MHTSIRVVISRVIALPSVKYSSRVEMDVLGETGREPTFAIITIDPEPETVYDNAAGESTKKATGLSKIAVSVCNIFSRMSHGYYG